MIEVDEKYLKKAFDKNGELKKNCLFDLKEVSKELSTFGLNSKKLLEKATNDDDAEAIYIRGLLALKAVGEDFNLNAAVNSFLQVYPYYQFALKFLCKYYLIIDETPDYVSIYTLIKNSIKELKLDKELIFLYAMINLEEVDGLDNKKIYTLLNKNKCLDEFLDGGSILDCVNYTVSSFFLVHCADEKNVKACIMINNDEDFDPEDKNNYLLSAIELGSTDAQYLYFKNTLDYNYLIEAYNKNDKTSIYYLDIIYDIAEGYRKGYIPDRDAYNICNSMYLDIITNYTDAALNISKYLYLINFFPLVKENVSEGEYSKNILAIAKLYLTGIKRYLMKNEEEAISILNVIIDFNEKPYKKDKEMLPIILDNKKEAYVMLADLSINNNFSYAVSCLEQAAKYDSLIYNKIGLYYYNGYKTLRDVDKAIEYFNKAGGSYLTTLYLFGDGFTRSFDKAIESYEACPLPGVNQFSYGLALLKKGNINDKQKAKKALSEAVKSFEDNLDDKNIAAAISSYCRSLIEAAPKVEKIETSKKKNKKAEKEVIVKEEVIKEDYKVSCCANCLTYLKNRIVIKDLMLLNIVAYCYIHACIDLYKNKDKVVFPENIYIDQLAGRPLKKVKQEEVASFAIDKFNLDLKNFLIGNGTRNYKFVFNTLAALYNSNKEENVFVCGILAKCYENGWGTIQNPTIAKRLNKKAL